MGTDMGEVITPRVLLIEDDAVLAGLLSAQFHHEGLECVVATSGEEALERLARDAAINAILLDISLPGIDGFEVLSDIKHNPRTASIPVIIISNFSQDKDIAWGKQLGAERFISKISVVPADIVSITREVIAGPRREDFIPK